MFAISKNRSGININLCNKCHCASYSEKCFVTFSKSRFRLTMSLYATRCKFSRTNMSLYTTRWNLSQTNNVSLCLSLKDISDNHVSLFLSLSIIRLLLICYFAILSEIIVLIMPWCDARFETLPVINCLCLCCTLKYVLCSNYCVPFNVTHLGIINDNDNLVRMKSKRNTNEYLKIIPLLTMLSTTKLF